MYKTDLIFIGNRGAYGDYSAKTGPPPLGDKDKGMIFPSSLA